jgi:hypothetical protein
MIILESVLIVKVYSCRQQKINHYNSISFSPLLLNSYLTVISPIFLPM